MDARLDGILLGMVGQLVAVRWPVYSPHSKGRTVQEFLLAVLCIPISHPRLDEYVWHNTITQAQTGIGSLAGRLIN